MIDDATRFEGYAEQTASDLRKTFDIPKLFGALQKVDEAFRPVSAEDFKREFLAARFALACIFWEDCCKENRLNGERIEKALLRHILQGFQTPEALAGAKTFSDYLYCPGTEDTNLPVIAIVKKLHERLHLDGGLKTEEGHDKISAGFRYLTETLEGFKTRFKNNLDDFCVG